MIDEPRGVPREIPIDIITLREGEDIYRCITGFEGFGVLPGATALAFELVDALAKILDDRCVLGNEAGGIHAAAVDF